MLIKIIVEIYKIENKKTIEKISETNASIQLITHRQRTRKKKREAPNYQCQKLKGMHYK